MDLYLRLDDREFPLHASLKLVEGVTQSPLCDGRGLKHTLERRVFELAKTQLGEVHFEQAFVPVAADRLGLAEPASECRSFGTNMMEAVLRAYAGVGRRLSDDELNRLIDALGLWPEVLYL